MRLEYTSEQEKQLRITEIMAILENGLYADDEEEKELISELKELECCIGLCTFPDDDKDYCKYFEVPKDWLIDILERLDSMNERKGVDLERFLDNYVWDETWFIYELAKDKGKLIMEEKQE